MIFTPEEIQKLYDIIDYRLARIVADVMGDELLTPEDKSLLRRYGYKWRREIEKIPPYFQSYLFGRLSAQLEPSQLVTLNFDDFTKYIDRHQWAALTSLEQEVYYAAATRTYSYIKTMGERAKTIMSNAVSEEEVKALVEKQRQLELGTIKKEMIEGVLKKKSVQNIVSNIGHSLEDWNRDWGRIVETEMQNIYQTGVAQQIMKEQGADALVYKEVFSGACQHCIKFYTTAGIGSKPRIFKLIDLINNGDNIGVKAKDWKPVLGATHPYCYDDKTEVLTNDGFKFFKDLKGDEEFLSVNLDSGEGEYVKAVKWINQPYKGDMVLRESRDFNLCTTPNHFHVGKTSKTGNCLIEEDKLRNCFKFLVTIPKWVGEDLPYLEFDGIKYDFKAFVEFMGYLMSDGCCLPHRKRVSISQIKPDVRKDIIECTSKLFPNWGEAREYIQISLAKRPELLEFFSKMEGQYTRRIPNFIRNATPETISIFLEAFRKGDGTLHKGKFWKGYQFKPQVHYTTSNPWLADEIGELVLKTGERPSFRNHGKAVYDDKKKGKVYTSKHDILWVNVLRSKYNLREKMKERVIHYEGYIYDVELERNHTLIVRRNGKVCVSGNCRCDLKEAPKGMVWNDETHSFEPPKEPYKRQVERKSKVKIYVGDKLFEV